MLNPQSCAQALATAQALGLDRLDTHLLLLHTLGKPGSARAWLLTHDTEVLTQDVAQRFRALSQRRAGGEPLAYLVGNKEFFGLELQVDARVLVPRPDTETLVQWALDVLKLSGQPTTPKVLDLGTGSGAIALAIAHTLLAEKRSVHVIAVDASDGALSVARRNSEILQLSQSLEFINSNWFEKVSGKFCLIVSNPPYITNTDPHLEALVHEPLTALTAGADGLDDIRQIIEQAPPHLEPGGWLLLEHGYNQAPAVQALLVQRGFMQVQGQLDLNGITRCSGGQWNDATRTLAP